ncbi:glucoamylase family protein [Thiorhodovibrio frisius]|uniref:glucoamylase family protein n=1 Tax=Thiorhodovibrio frisius TaxID=631362 RepID=UPI0002DB197F|nr:glucoamylase family protein [Thiorhodovibrio frisius]
MTQTPALPPAADAEPLSLADEAMLDGLQRAAFDYFVRHTNRDNGLVADTSRPGSHASIAVVGFALSAYPVGVERGWMTRAEALQRSLTALRFFRDSDQSGTPESTGYRGFYFHFLHQDSGTRARRCEVSLIDTALLLAGMLTAAAYFTAATADETELRALADRLYRRVDWCWAQRKGAALVMGWKPKSGFLNYGWEGYSEALLLYTLGLGSPTHPLSEASFPAWTSTYQWENLYGIDFLYAGPLFIHQFSHAWIDFRDIRDDFMREKHCDYFENSRRATYVQREYAIRNPRGFVGYGEDGWGLSAGDGPKTPRQRIAGRRQSFYGYAARGVPYGLDDGTLSGPSVLASLVFAPEIALPAIRRMLARGSATDDRAARASGYNDTVHDGWISEGTFGLDQGLIVLMIENFRSGLLWRLLRGSKPIRTGLHRAGFRGGWLAEGGQP